MIYASSTFSRNPKHFLRLSSLSHSFTCALTCARTLALALSPSLALFFFLSPSCVLPHKYPERGAAARISRSVRRPPPRVQTMNASRHLFSLFAIRPREKFLFFISFSLSHAFYIYIYNIYFIKYISLQTTWIKCRRPAGVITAQARS